MAPGPVPFNGNANSLKGNAFFSVVLSLIALENQLFIKSKKKVAQNIFIWYLIWFIRPESFLESTNCCYSSSMNDGKFVNYSQN